jgi:hypothetical protein
MFPTMSLVPPHFAALTGLPESVELDFSRPGKPTDNARVESVNDRFRQHCLNTHWFMSRDDARRKIDVAPAV